MKVLIIGGTRFFGYFIARRLVEDGHDVTLFNRGLTPDDFGTRVKRVHGDRYDAKDFSEKFENEHFDVVVDMIAYRAEDSRAAVRVFSGKIGHFIHISTGSVYVVTKDFPCPLREEDFNRELYPQPRENDELWQYGYHKRKCEEVLRESFAREHFPVTILRLPVVIGERDYTLRAYSYFIRIEDGKPLILPDSGLNVFTYIYQGDVVKTIASNLLNQKSFGQSYNLAQGEILSLRGFVLKAAEILEKKLELVDIPSRVLEELSLGTSFSPFFRRRPFVLATEKARADLNFSSTPFGLWLERTIRWFKEEYRCGPPENYEFRKTEIEIAQKYQRLLKALKR